MKNEEYGLIQCISSAISLRVFPLWLSAIKTSRYTLRARTHLASPLQPFPYTNYQQLIEKSPAIADWFDQESNLTTAEIMCH